MRSPSKIVLCINDKDRGIISKDIKFKSIFKDSNLINIPFIRGILALSESILINIKVYDTVYEQLNVKKDKTMYFVKYFFLLILFSFIFPLLLSEIAVHYLDYTSDKRIAETIIRVLFFLSYVVFIRFSKQSNDILKYHGAEHKVINCFENNCCLNTDNASQSSRLHPRCGTNFLCVSLIVYTIIFYFIPWKSFLYRFLLEFASIPLIVSLSYEIINANSKRDVNSLNFLVNIPGLALQLLTTKEPDKSQIDLAIKAFNLCNHKK